MIKVTPYYMSDKDIQESEEPYKSVAIIIDRLYLMAQRIYTEDMNGKQYRKIK